MLSSLMVRLGASNALAKILAPVALAMVLLLGYVLAFALGWYTGSSSWEDKLTTYTTQVKERERIVGVQIKNMQDANTTLLKDLEKSLVAHRDVQKETVTVIKRIPYYVSVKDDAACTITNGVVWVHDLPLAAELPGISRRPPPDGSSPSTVKLSDLARTNAQNNIECVTRGKLLRAWQDWYVANKAEWDRTRAIAPPPL